ncbi:MAG TPA: DnaJ domain-containing protein [Candidatus Dormibacteraeota bacterium]|nr:DnaJ domain-containing protein [Candidatus Dormibacteraeota bacterium]
MAAKDYYKTLGVDRKATPEQIKASFRKQARKYHPDANKGDAEATKKFKELSEAYDVLGDPKKRGEYDNPVSQFRRGSGAGAPSGGNPFGGGTTVEWDMGDIGDLGDIFSGMFRGRGPAGPGARTSAPREQAYETPVELTLKEAIEGARRLVREEDGRQLEVTFPAGVVEGSKVRAGGNHTFTVRLQPDPAWRIEGRDLHGDLEVPDHIAVLGGEVTAPTPTGRRISLNIAPGSHAGKVMRIRGKGVPGLGGAPAGDLRLHLRVTVPAKPSEEQRTLYEQLRDLAGPAPG